uniref:NADH-ubiquinone oxidoreductase chain 4 n=1 Tax=Allobathynella sp. JHS-2017 TaxID=2025385 RepID=A0A7R6D7P4_9CRUS|nr:NADH dehydrogenase subunit 4 [Allobathynella sp. JHS-2017]
MYLTLFLMLATLFIYNNKMLLLSLMMMLMFFICLNSSSLIIIKMNSMFLMDSVSFILVVLTLWIFVLAMSTTSYMLSFNMHGKLFKMVLILMAILLYFTFTVNNLMLFYIFFEASLIPMFMLISGWGYQPERLKASIYLLFYTLFGSLPLLIILLYFMLLNGSLSMLESIFIANNLVYLLLFFSFFIKMPMFLVHLWLPKAHVEAPLVGSMILAAVLLKLGGYGIIRFSAIFENCLKLPYNFFIILSLVGGVLTSCLCFMQNDIKAIVAYSSVVHMSLLLASVLTKTNWGLLGSIILMISHGLCSSGLFFMANSLYLRSNSRSLLFNKGQMVFFSSASLMWFLLLSSNMSAPPSLNLLGEINLIFGLMKWYYYILLLLFIWLVLSIIYSIFLYSYTQHGKLSSKTPMSSSLLVSEMISSMSHWLPLNMLFLTSKLWLA